MSNNSLLQRVKAVLAKPDTILFIGSGVSLWSQLPTWPKLISDLAGYLDHLGRDGNSVRREIESNDLLLAASYGVFQLNKREFGEFMRRACLYQIAQPTRIHELILRLALPHGIMLQQN